MEGIDSSCEEQSTKVIGSSDGVSRLLSSRSYAENRILFLCRGFRRILNNRVKSGNLELVWDACSPGQLNISSSRLAKLLCFI